MNDVVLCSFKAIWCVWKACVKTRKGFFLSGLRGQIYTLKLKSPRANVWETETHLSQITLCKCSMTKTVKCNRMLVGALWSDKFKLMKTVGCGRRGQRLRFDAGTRDLYAEIYCSRLTEIPKNAWIHAFICASECTTCYDDTVQMERLNLNMRWDDKYQLVASYP